MLVQVQRLLSAVEFKDFSSGRIPRSFSEASPL